jgi:hypothetical protein
MLRLLRLLTPTRKEQTMDLEGFQPVAPGTAGQLFDKLTRVSRSEFVRILGNGPENGEVGVIQCTLTHVGGTPIIDTVLNGGLHMPTPIQPPEFVPSKPGDGRAWFRLSSRQIEIRYETFGRDNTWRTFLSL